MRQGRWLELFKDYDLFIYYYLEKVILFVDALNRKSLGSIATSISSHRYIRICERKKKFKICLPSFRIQLANAQGQPIIIK